MAGTIIYVDTSDVRAGALDVLRLAVKELIDFVDANESRIIAYGVYFSEDGTKMTVIQVHPDSASLEYHMAVAAPLFPKFVDLVSLSSLRIYGEPTPALLRQLQEKARLLGHSEVQVSSLHDGFMRSGGV
jgi:hypothetical protein